MMRRAGRFAIALLAAAAFAGGAQAEQASTAFNIGVIITGPSLPVDQHPRLGGRALHSDGNALFQAVPGTPAQVRETLMARLARWQWQQDELAEDGSRRQALGHSPQGQCMQVQARSVMEQPMVRLLTQGCGRH